MLESLIYRTWAIAPTVVADPDHQIKGGGGGGGGGGGLQKISFRPSGLQIGM